MEGWGKRIRDGVGLRNREGFLEGYTGARREERGRLQGREEVLARVQMEQSGRERPGLPARALVRGSPGSRIPGRVRTQTRLLLLPGGRAAAGRGGAGAASWRLRRPRLSGPGLRAAAERDPGDGGGK